MTASDRELRAILAAAVEGSGPPADLATVLLPRPTGPVSAVLAFTGHHVVAADVDRRWLEQALGDDFSAAHRTHFLTGLGDQIGARPGHLDLVLALGPGESVQTADIELARMPSAEAAAHRRVARALDYRSDATAWWTAGGNGVLVIGRGLAGRFEVSFEVAPTARGNGLGRALAGAARRLVPPDQPVFAQVSPGNVRSVRAVLGAGYVPIGAEVLYHHGRDPRRGPALAALPARSPPGVTIREARPAEWSAVGELTVAAYVADGMVAGDGDYADELRDAAPRAAGALLLVAVDSADEVVGTVTFCRPGSPYAELARPGEAEFRMLAVPPEHRGRGVAEALVRGCLERARAAGDHAVVLSTMDMSAGAQRIYRRLGFVATPDRDWEPVRGLWLRAYRCEVRSRHRRTTRW